VKRILKPGEGPLRAAAKSKETELHVEPGTVKRWSCFKKESPPGSIALDGYVMGRPRFDPDGPYSNFNHHEEVERLATRSTCGQVYIAIKQGLLDSYMREGRMRCHIFVNDADQDTCLAVWLLRNHERISGVRSEPLISRLVYMEDMLDTSAGAYPFDPTMKAMRSIAWVFEPYTVARIAGSPADLDSKGMKAIIDSVSERISSHVMGRGGEITLDTRYNKFAGRDNWVMIKEIGAHARSRLFADGKKAFISVKDRPDGRYSYVIGKMSPFVRFPLERFYDTFNEAEGIAEDDTDRWGGSDTIGGSPRKRGSGLSPHGIERIISGILAE